MREPHVHNTMPWSRSMSAKASLAGMILASAGCSTLPETDISTPVESVETMTLVVEVGGSGTVAQSVRAVAFSGCISMIGVLTGLAGEVPTAELFTKNACISGITVGSQAHQRDMIAAVEANGLEPVIDSTYPLELLAEAFRHQESQRHFGKICVSI